MKSRVAGGPGERARASLTPLDFNRRAITPLRNIS